MDKSSKFQSLRGQLLIAIQTEPGEFFHKTVVLLTEHTPKFAEGLIINKPMSATLQQQILDKLEITPKLVVPTLFQGGPVDLTHGSVLHSVEYETPDTAFITDDISLTQTHQILMDIANQQAPKHFLFCIGHTAWQAHQLEEEIMGNIWIPIPATAKLLFDTPNEKKWQDALATLKIDTSRFSLMPGKA